MLIGQHFRVFFLSNHTLHGSVIYSSELMAGNFTTASDEPLTISNGTNGLPLSMKVTETNTTTNASFVTTDTYLLLVGRAPQNRYSPPE